MTGLRNKIPDIHELVAVHSSTIAMTSTDRVHERVESLIFFHETCAAMVRRIAYACCRNIPFLGVGPQWVVVDRDFHVAAESDSGSAMSRYDLTDFEWRVIAPLLPNKPRGVPRVDDRRVLNGIFWVLRSGAPWRDLPERYGPRTACYNRFVRWRRAGVWDRLMDAITKAHDGKVQMIDTSIVRVYQQGCDGKKGDRDHCLGRSRGGLTTKIHALSMPKAGRSS